LRSHTE
jgi:hypothetical protein